ncbi:uncharacterized protein G2W53_031369 [Senna tora]|uniref:Uncharacterized protein n=1 Tax=Senna tora TaxID=362788 RepID=A0A834WBQ0_9FABA|nr:uncharacterized protein G2W53_031369 [Senna tora]
MQKAAFVYPKKRSLLNSPQEKPICRSKQEAHRTTASETEEAESRAKGFMVLASLESSTPWIKVSRI